MKAGPGGGLACGGRAGSQPGGCGKKAFGTASGAVLGLRQDAVAPRRRIRCLWETNEARRLPASPQLSAAQLPRPEAPSPPGPPGAEAVPAASSPRQLLTHCPNPAVA